MTADERARFERFRHDADRVMFALGRVMARTLVGRALGVEPAAWPWREGPHGRPEIDRPGTDLHFNLSHSAGLVVCALGAGSRRRRGRRGSDAARARSGDRRRATARRPRPTTCDAQGDRWRDRFLTYWTLKEAYLKARGLGISVPLSDISFTLDARRRAHCVSSDRSPAPTTAGRFTSGSSSARHLAAVAVATPTAPRPTFAIQPF